MSGVSAHAPSEIRSRHCRLVAGAVAIACGLDEAEVGPDTRLVDDLGLDWVDLPAVLRHVRCRRPGSIDVAGVVVRVTRLHGEDAFARLTVTSLAELLDPEFGW